VSDGRQFIRYLAAGGASAVCNICARIFLSLLIPFEAAVSISFVIGLVTGFLFMRWFAFSNSTRSLRQQIGSYLLINLYGLLQTLFVSSVCLRLIFPSLHIYYHTELLAHVVALGLLAVTSYYGHRKITFR
jgi:putative flippase GtrA